FSAVTNHGSSTASALRPPNRNRRRSILEIMAPPPLEHVYKTSETPAWYRRIALEKAIGWDEVGPCELEVGMGPRRASIKVPVASLVAAVDHKIRCRSFAASQRSLTIQEEGETSGLLHQQVV
ncbi:unnamed protein product, partial [Chrysoparadoxa australica]